jgi:hypothetical protein
MEEGLRTWAQSPLARDRCLESLEVLAEVAGPDWKQRMHAVDYSLLADY